MGKMADWRPVVSALHYNAIVNRMGGGLTRHRTEEDRMMTSSYIWRDPQVIWRKLPVAPRWG